MPDTDITILTDARFLATPIRDPFVENVLKEGEVTFMIIDGKFTHAILDNQNQLTLTELELIEPELWFRFHP